MLETACIHCVTKGGVSHNQRGVVAVLCHELDSVACGLAFLERRYVLCCVCVLGGCAVCVYARVKSGKLE